MKVTIAGDGAWGSALALLLNGNGHHVSVWGPFPEAIAEVRNTRKNERFLPNLSFPESIHWTDNERDASGADLLVMAIPSQFFRSVAERFAPFTAGGMPVVSVTKGLEPDTCRRMSEVLADTLNTPVPVALSGPSFAEEVAHRQPTAVTIASADPSAMKRVQHEFSNDYFRVYTSNDVTGVELGGVLKNVMAIAAGISDGLGFGYNAKAALITRGLTEMTRLGKALGAQPETFSGLSGMGDLILTCTGSLSRNRAVGEQLGRGRSLDDILEDMNQVAEGVLNCKHILQTARTLKVSAPITEEVHAICYEGKDPGRAVHDLLTRDLKPE